MNGPIRFDDSKPPVEAVKAAGITVGTTLQTEKIHPGGNDWWEQERITLLFLGKHTTVWHIEQRNADVPEWPPELNQTPFSKEVTDWPIFGINWQSVTK